MQIIKQQQISMYQQIGDQRWTLTLQMINQRKEEKSLFEKVSDADIQDRMANSTL